MLAIGLMSGTSLDGIDACLVEITEEKGQFHYLVKGFVTKNYTSDVRERIIDISNPITSNVQKICSMNFELGYLHIDAIEDLLAKTNTEIEDIVYIAMHGQTIWHNPNNQDGYFSSTMQIGEASLVSYHFNKTVINNFRVMDMAASGCGAPLIPFVHYALYRNDKINIAIQNIGGIGNITYLRSGCSSAEIVAFDTGPGNMLIDGAMKKLYDLPYDEFGKIASCGKVHQTALDELMKDEYLIKPYPKSTGREKYNEEFLINIMKKILEDGTDKDVITTLTTYTALTIVDSCERFLGPIDQLILAGGGSHNDYLVKIIKEKLPEVDVKISPIMDELESLGFAILGHATLQHLPNNIPTATGAKMPVVLGQITFPPKGGIYESKENIDRKPKS